MQLGIRLYTLLNGRRVGCDAYGNRYYEQRFALKRARHRRWVLYKGLPEASKAPAGWHSWLRHNTNTIPAPKAQKSSVYLPNLTGTNFAYRPAGHVLKAGQRPPATGDYDSWQP